MSSKKNIATFIMPIYINNESEIDKYFIKSIDGILNQTDKDFQVVIIDDNSQKFLFKKISEKINQLNDNRFHVFRCKKNRGPGYCRNIGIKFAHKSNSDIILFNDYDDISNPNRLKRVREILTKNVDVDVVYSKFIPIDEYDNEIIFDNLVGSLKNILEGNENDPVNDKNILIKLGTQKNYTNLTSSTAVRTSLAYKFPFPKYRASEDCYTWFLYASNGGGFYYSSDIPTKYRLRDKGSSNTRKKLSDFYRTKVKVDSLGFKKALKLYSKNHLILKNEKIKIMHDFYTCLYNVVKNEASDKTLNYLDKMIKKYSFYLDVNIKKSDNYVVQVIVPQLEGGVGGSDTHVLNLSEGLNNDKIFSPIILFTRNKEYLEKIKNLDISYIFCGNCASKLKLLYLLSDFPKKYNIKIVHSHQYNANYLVASIKFFNIKWKSIPYVMTCHGWIENNIKDKYYTFWDFFTYLFANILVCVSKKDIKRLNEGFYKNKNKVYIPNGVNIKDNIKHEKKLIMKKYNIPDNKTIISYVGRLAPEKRLDLVIKSAERICKKNENVIYIICGSGELDEEIKLMIKEYSLNEKVFMLGYISDMSEIYSISDINILLSDTEGTPRVILESMANKIPVLCTNVGGLKEIIESEKNGILVNKNDCDGVVEELDKLINNIDLRKKYADAGFKTVNKIFNLDNMVKDIVKVYENLIKKRI